MSVATASRNGDVVWDAKGSEVVPFRAEHGVTTYWKGESLKRKAQSEEPDERPAKKQKQKQKKQHRRFTEPVTYEYDEGVQSYLKALEEKESKAMSKLSGGTNTDIDLEPNPPSSPRPQQQALELSPTAAAALASTSGMLSNRSGAATPPHLSQRMLSDRLLMPPPPRPIPLYHPPQAPIPSRILAWKIDPSYRCLSYLVSSHGSHAGPL